MAGWRVWFAFEVRPGITKHSTLDLSEHCRGLRALCRKPNGKIDVEEYLRWLDLLMDHSHLLDTA